MTETQEIINELLSIEFFLDSLKKRATGLRVRLQGEAPAAAPSGGLGEAQINQIRANRENSIAKRQRHKKSA